MSAVSDLTLSPTLSAYSFAFVNVLAFSSFVVYVFDTELVIFSAVCSILVFNFSSFSVARLTSDVIPSLTSFMLASVSSDKSFRLADNSSVFFIILRVFVFKFNISSFAVTSFERYSVPLADIVSVRACMPFNSLENKYVIISSFFFSKANLEPKSSHIIPSAVISQGRYVIDNILSAIFSPIFLSSSVVFP